MAALREGHKKSKRPAIDLDLNATEHAARMTEVFGPTDVDLADTFTTAEIARAYRVSTNTAGLRIGKAIALGQAEYAGKAPRVDRAGRSLLVPVYRLTTKP